MMVERIEDCCGWDSGSSAGLAPGPEEGTEGPPWDFQELQDDQLVLATLAGYGEAFDTLVTRFRGAVTAIARQALGSRDAAEDAAQEAFILAYRSLRQLHDPCRFAAWLCAITRHHSRRIARREQRTAAVEPAVLELLACEAFLNPENQALDAMERAAVQEALKQLPEPYRLVLEFYYYDEWPVARIAGFLSLPPSTVKWRLRHGRELLRRRLEQRSIRE
jgi:RNA polymerase sigma-70 factor (ECF subfamily)